MFTDYLHSLVFGFGCLAVSSLSGHKISFHNQPLHFPSYATSNITIYIHLLAILCLTCSRITDFIINFACAFKATHQNHSDTLFLPLLNPSYPTPDTSVFLFTCYLLFFVLCFIIPFRVSPVQPNSLFIYSLYYTINLFSNFFHILLIPLLTPIYLGSLIFFRGLVLVPSFKSFPLQPTPHIRTFTTLNH